MSSPSSDKPERRVPQWVSRGDTMAVFSLTVVFFVWVSVVAIRQYRVGRQIEVVRSHAAEWNFVVDINTASAGELTLLEGIGVKRAERIVEWRQEHGPFQTFEEVQEAARLSDKEVKRLRELATLGETAAFALPPNDE